MRDDTGTQKERRITRTKLLAITVVIFCLFGLVITAGVTTGFRSRQEVLISGNTMGTTYHIKAVVAGKMSGDYLAQLITERLAEVNRSMSVYDEASEISRFNRALKGEKIEVSEGFRKVLSEGEVIYRATGGAWDATVGPLVDLWGFGPGKQPERYPDGGAIKDALARVGYSAIGRDGTSIVKKRDGVSMDLGSIAKGYGVDAVSELLREKKVLNFLVEIGGEVFAEGARMDGTPWRVGINSPDRGGDVGDLFQVRTLSGKALATSGDYRNFLEVDGRIWTHVIDPRTGRPVENGVTSASVEANTAVFADGLATALMVMGPERSIALVDSLGGVECLLIVRSPGGGLTVHASKGWVPSTK